VVFNLWWATLNTCLEALDSGQIIAINSTLLSCTPYHSSTTLVIDEFWDETGDPYGRNVGDSNSYTTERIGDHHVVIALLPAIGKVNAAVAVASLRASYNNIKLALLTGICGGVPRAGSSDEILLSDVIISETVWSNMTMDTDAPHPPK
jgi:nucleoside phosphorylase